MVFANLVRKWILLKLIINCSNAMQINYLEIHGSKLHGLEMVRTYPK